MAVYCSRIESQKITLSESNLPSVMIGSWRAASSARHRARQRRAAPAGGGRDRRCPPPCSAGRPAPPDFRPGKARNYSRLRRARRYCCPWSGQTRTIRWRAGSRRSRPCSRRTGDHLVRRHHRISRPGRQGLHHVGRLAQAAIVHPVNVPIPEDPGVGARVALPGAVEDDGGAARLRLVQLKVQNGHRIDQGIVEKGLEPGSIRLSDDAARQQLSAAMVAKPADCCGEFGLQERLANEGCADVVQLNARSLPPEHSRT